MIENMERESSDGKSWAAFKKAFAMAHQNLWDYQSIKIGTVIDISNAIDENYLLITLFSLW